MHLKVVALDYDGTLAADGVVADETWSALSRLKTSGFSLMLVTGRSLDDLLPRGPLTTLFDALVAEDGAALYLPHSDSLSFPFGKLEPDVTEALKARDIPLQLGSAIAATWVPHDAEVLAVLRASGGSATVSYNKGAVMVLPPGATKGTGLLAACAELGYSARNVVACGDAENDRSLFKTAELAVAVANALPTLKTLADVVLTEANGAGVRHLAAKLLAGELPGRPRRAARHLRLGETHRGEPVTLDPFALTHANLGIVGSSATGKSYLAGLLTEELLKHGYQVCLIDPEGDYRGLRHFPHTLHLGGPGASLPDAGDLITLLEYAGVSLILDLSGQSGGELTYTEALLRGLLNLRARRGRPHWLLLDEAQYLCSSAPLRGCLQNGLGPGGVALVSYAPEHLDAELLATLDHWLITGFKDSSSYRAVAKFLDAPRSHAEAEALSELQGQVWHAAAKNRPRSGATGTVSFFASQRATTHVRHLQKYLRVPLPAEKRFYFRGGASASNLWEFSNALAALSPELLSYYLKRGDFVRWLRGALGEEVLAKQLVKLEQHAADPATWKAAAVELTRRRYEALEELV